MKKNKLIKTGLIGFAITTALYLILFLIGSVSFRTFAPLYMPWSVLLLIGLTNNNNNQNK